MPLSIRQPIFEAGDTGPPTEAIRAALDSVLTSNGFRRSARHSQFLRFVCETTLAGEAAKLNEYWIAQEVFGRGPDYSPGDDSVVRRQAYSLRQKLQGYYSSEGKYDSVRIELPVGRYVPAFGWSSLQEAAPEPPRLKNAPAPAFVSWRPARWLTVALILAVICAALGYAIGTRLRPASSPDPAVAELWGPWLTDPAGAVICFSNPTTAIVRQIPDDFPRETFSYRVAVAPQEVEQLRQVTDLPAGSYFFLSPGIAHAKMGEALGGVALAAFLSKAGVPARATQSRLLNWESFRHANMILLGHGEANRWLDPILSKLPFRLAAFEGDKPRRIVNVNPAKGESSEYHVTGVGADNQPVQDYVLVSMLRGIDGRHRLLLINGVNAKGTNVAVDFLTDPASVRGLLEALRRASVNHKGVWRFQAILREEERDRIPTRADLVAVRVLRQD